MYRYEVSLTVKNDIEQEIGKPLFYTENSKYYINDDNRHTVIHYNESDGQGDFNPVMKDLDEICQKLYTSNFSDNSTQEEYIEPATHVQTDYHPPFAAKTLPNGKKLYARTHGKKFTVTPGQNTLEFDIPYGECKLSGVQIINCELAECLDFFVLDDDVGTYSTIPNYPLNQFGFDVFMTKDSYVRESNYDASLYQNMTISIQYKAEVGKDVYINYMLHEVKD